MANWHSILQMSQKYGIPESTLRGWKCLGYITSSTVDNVVMLDEEDLIRFLDIKRTKGMKSDSLEKMIKEKEQERDILLSQLDDNLYLLKTQKLFEPLYKIIIRELGGLITDGSDRDIFVSISLGEPIVQVAERHKMTYDQVTTRYGQIFEELGKNPERISTYRKHVMTLLFGKYDTDYPTTTDLSQIVSERACRILHKLDIKTVHQLLQYTSQHGWPALKRLEGMGISTYKEIINALFNANFIIIRKDQSIALSPEIAAYLL